MVLAKENFRHADSRHDSYSHARNALKAVLDGVVQDADVTIISRRDAEGDAVVMSLDSYNSIMETLYLTSNHTNAAALAKCRCAR